MYNLKTFSYKDHYWLDKFEDFRNNLQDNHYRIDNYKTNWPVKGNLAYTVFLDDNEIYGFSTVYCNDFYPKKHARILNRYYISPEYRESHINKRLNRSIECALSQIDWCLNHSDIDVLFISYEGYKPFWIKSWTKLINTKLVKQNLKFFTDDNFYQTCNTQTKLCWQHVSHCCISKNSLKLNSISYESWKNLKNE